MTAIPPSEFPREIMQLFDKYVHGDIDRRGFLEGAGKYAVGGISAAAYLSALSPDFANAQQIRPNDPRLWTESIRVPSPNGSGTINAYLARPRHIPFWRKLPVIIVVHENRGLNPHIQDITRRLALENYVAISPDALTALGGYPGNEDTARAKFATLDQTKILQDFIAAARFARVTEHANNKLGAIGFCYGGGMANYLATHCDFLNAAVPFYGAAPPLDGVANIRAKLMLHFASDDERFNAMWPPYEAALKAANKNYVAYTYEGTMHGFNNDTTPRYNAAAAALAWQRTIAFFNRELKNQ